MALETDICGFGPAYRIDHREGARAVTHEHLVMLRVHPNVVRILAELDAPGRSEIVAPQNPHRAAAPVRHVDAVGRGDIGHALRLAEAGNRTQHPASCQVDYTQAVIAELGDEKSLALGVDAEVIDAAAHLSERDLRLEHERCPGCLSVTGDRPEQGHGEQDRQDQAASAAHPAHLIHEHDSRTGCRRSTSGSPA